MRLFLSYPSEIRSQVEEVATRLRTAGHRVFFASEDLPSGDSFDDRIRRAIRQSDAFLCFLTPEFVALGRYTLSELEIAKRKWPSPTGHILPVRVRELPIETLPSYLRAVTILEPKGNLAADVIAALAGLKTRHTIRGVLAAFALLALLLALFLWYRQPHLDVAKPDVRLEVPGYAGNPDQYTITARSAYRGAPSDLERAQVEFLHAGDGQQSEWVGELLKRVQPTDRSTALATSESRRTESGSYTSWTGPQMEFLHEWAKITPAGIHLQVGQDLEDLWAHDCETSFVVGQKGIILRGIRMMAGGNGSS